MKHVKKVFGILLVMAVLMTSVYFNSYIAKAEDIIEETTITSIKEENGAKVTLKWKKVTGASGYTVYRKTGKSGSLKKIATVIDSNTVKYVDKTVKENTTYYYAVCVCMGTEKSTYSADAKVKTSKAPSRAKIKEGDYFFIAHNVEKQGNKYAVTGTIQLPVDAFVSIDDYKKFKVGKMYQIGDNMKYCAKKVGSVFYFTEFEGCSLKASLNGSDMTTCRVDENDESDGKIPVYARLEDYKGKKWYRYSMTKEKKVVIPAKKNVPITYQPSPEDTVFTKNTFDEFYSKKKKGIHDSLKDHWRGLYTLYSMIDQDGYIDYIEELWSEG
ncbi:MAG: hypothetical protein PUD20_09105 [bacterium]|nr:hypothetical protein [bacterium]